MTLLSNNPLRFKNNLLQNDCYQENQSNRYQSIAKKIQYNIPKQTANWKSCFTGKTHVGKAATIKRFEYFPLHSELKKKN